MIKVFSVYVYAFLDPEEGLSFVTSYDATQFDIFRNKHYEPFSVSTPVGVYILAKRVYRECPVSINHKIIIAY